MLNKIEAILDRFLDLSWLVQGNVQKGRLKAMRMVAIIIVIIFFGYLVYKGWLGLGQIISHGINFHFEYLLISLLCQIVGITLAVYVWHDILNQLNISASFIFNYEVFCVSAIARKIPGGVWYAFSRVAAYSFLKKSNWVLLIAVIIESLSGVFAGGLNFGLSLISGTYVFNWQVDQRVIGIVILIGLIILVASGPTIIQYAIRRSLKSKHVGDFSEIHIRYLDMIRWIAAEAIVLILASFVGYFLLKAIDPGQNPSFFLLSGSFNLGVVLSPIAMWLPGNAGIRDGLVYLALLPVLGAEKSAFFALAWRIWVYILEIVAGTICGIDLKRRLTATQLSIKEEE